MILYVQFPPHFFMKRISFAVAASLLLAPMSGLAAYTSPAELMAAVQDTSVARAFSVTAHAKSEGMYISVWASGTELGADPMTISMSTKATVDIVKDAMKMRVKAELLAVNGMLYVRVLSIDGSFQNEFASASTIVKQKQWLSFPLDQELLEEITGGEALQFSASNPSEAEHMFHMQSKPGKNDTTVYTLSFTQDYAVTVAQLIREMLQDNSPSTDDFFPWRQLAEGMRFENTIVTDAKGGFLFSTFSLSTASKNASLAISGTEQRLGKAPVIKAPAQSLTADQVLALFMSSMGEDPAMMMPSSVLDVPVPSSVDSGSLTEEDVTFDSVDESYAPVTPSVDCTDSSLSAQQLSMLQRDGTCPVAKKSTRFGGW